MFVTRLEGVRKSQSKTLAALVWGLMHGRRLGVAALGRALPGSAKPKHRIKRVDRFLGNKDVNLLQAVRPIPQWLAGPRKTLCIALDWTDLHNGYQTLKAAVVIRSRAIPVLWKTVAKDQLLLEQNRLEEEFVQTLRKLIPSSLQVILLADRGFCRVELQRALQRLKFGYVIRVRRDAWVSGAEWEGRLGKLRVWPSMLKDLGIVAYHKSARKPVRIVIWYARNQKEPWFLATNLAAPPRQVATLYARRMEIEEYFKDLKNSKQGFGLRGLNLSSAERWDRMFLIMAWAYFLLVVVGAQAEAKGWHRSLMANTSKQRSISLWKVGHMMLHRFRYRLESLLDHAFVISFSS